MFDPIEVILPQIKMTTDLFKIYLLMFHEGKKQAKIRQNNNMLLFDNAWGYKVCEIFEISDRSIHYLGQTGYGVR